MSGIEDPKNRFPSKYEQRVNDLWYTSEWFWWICSPLVVGAVGLIAMAIKNHLD